MLGRLLEREASTTAGVVLAPASDSHHDGVPTQRVVREKIIEQPEGLWGSLKLSYGPVNEQSGLEGNYYIGQVSKEENRAPSSPNRLFPLLPTHHLKTFPGLWASSIFRPDSFACGRDCRVTSLNI
jgi:hypothetical protein